MSHTRRDPLHGNRSSVPVAGVARHRLRRKRDDPRPGSWPGGRLVESDVAIRAETEHGEMKPTDCGNRSVEATALLLAAGHRSPEAYHAGSVDLKGGQKPAIEPRVGRGR